MNGTLTGSSIGEKLQAINERQFSMVTGRKTWPNGNSVWSLAKNMAERQFGMLTGRKTWPNGNSVWYLGENHGRTAIRYGNLAKK